MNGSGNEEIFTTWTSELDDADAMVVCLCGELDASTAPSFLSDMKEVITRRRNLIMDVHLLSYTDSTGIAAILSIKHALKDAGRVMCMAGCHGLVTKIIDALGVRNELQCCDDVDQAVARLK